MTLHQCNALRFGIVLAVLGAPHLVQAQPALTGETTLVNAAGPRAVAAGGASTVFGGEVFDAALQPAVLGDARDFELGYSVEHDRFPLRNAALWSAGVLVPLQSLDRHLPAIAMLHRRLRADASIEARILGIDRRIELGYATDVTTLAAGWAVGADDRARTGRGGSVGMALHVVESAGELRSTTFESPADTTRTVTGGLEDLLFAATLGVVGRWSRPLGDTNVLQARAGAVWRRAGEESDALSATLALTNLGAAALDLLRFDDSIVTSPIMASEIAIGAGLRLRTPHWQLLAQGERAQGVYAGAPDAPSWRWGTELQLFDHLRLRGGGVDDLRLHDLVVGLGVEVPLRAQWKLGVDVAFEPARFSESTVGDAAIWGVRLSGPLPHRDPAEAEPEAAEETIEELLDALDEWLDDDPEQE